MIRILIWNLLKNHRQSKIILFVFFSTLWLYVRLYLYMCRVFYAKKKFNRSHRQMTHIDDDDLLLNNDCSALNSVEEKEQQCFYYFQLEIFLVIYLFKTPLKNNRSPVEKKNRRSRNNLWIDRWSWLTHRMTKKLLEFYKMNTSSFILRSFRGFIFS